MAGAAAEYYPVDCCLSRECLHSEGGKLNWVEGQSCCAAVLTARLGRTEGGRRPRGIPHMKRVWSTKHLFFYLFWPLVQARSMGRGFLEVSTHSH